MKLLTKKNIIFGIVFVVILFFLRQQMSQSSGNFQNKWNKNFQSNLEKNIKQSDYYAKRLVEEQAKWGESAQIVKLGDLPRRVIPENPVMKFDTGVCFDLSKIKAPWFLYDSRSSPDITTQGKHTSFSMGVMSRDFGNAYKPTETDITISRNQEFIRVHVEGQVVEKNGKKALWRRGQDPSLERLRELIDLGNMEETDQSFEYKQWSLLRYGYNLSSRQSRLIDFDNKAHFKEINWDYRSQKPWPRSPLDSIGTGHIHSENEEYRILFFISAYSIPNIAEIFDRIDREVKRLIVPCE